MALIHRRHLVRLEREVDVFIARELAATLAVREGFDRYQASDIETAISEVATNALKYGKRGWASLRIDRSGFEAIVTDEGPGFGAAPKSPTGLGVGLAGVKRLMDSIDIKSLEEGSQVALRKNLSRSDVADAWPQWKVFAPYLTTQAGYEAPTPGQLGLGLTLARALIEATLGLLNYEDGSFEIRLRRDVGTTREN